ncbi:MAG: DUF3999 family protein [Pirellulaceae bacterium]
MKSTRPSCCFPCGPQRRAERLAFTAALVSVLMTGVVRAQQEPSAPPRDEPTSAAPRDESLQRWEYYMEIPDKPPGESPWYDLVLTPLVFDAARYDLADLRLYDAQGEEIPYALRVRTDQSELADIEAESFNRIEQEDGSRQVSLDLGEKPLEHNEVEVTMTGSDYRRKCVVEGSDDGKQWKMIRTEYLLDFQRNGDTLRDDTIRYPASRFRYLRVTVHPDPQQDASGDWQLQDVTVRRRVRIPGENVTRDAPHGDREPVPTDQGPGSQWLIDLGGESTPCAQLLVEIESDEFVRDWSVEAAGPDRPGEEFRWIAGGTWRRKAGEEKQSFVAQLPQDTRAARLKLLVTDNRNPPLKITSIKYLAPARQVVFAARPKSPQGPLRLYFGNPEAAEPRYDFARNLAPQLQPPPQRLRLGERETNPKYEPEPPPLTERLPWLVPVVLSAAVLVLAALIGSLALAALKQSDSAEPRAEGG